MISYETKTDLKDIIKQKRSMSVMGRFITPTDGSIPELADEAIFVEQSEHFAKKGQYRKALDYANFAFSLKPENLVNKVQFFMMTNVTIGKYTTKTFVAYCRNLMWT